MRRRTIISLVLTLAVISNVSGCGNKDKTTILSNDVKKEAAMQENEVKKLIEEGSNFLNSEKYDDAKSTFEKAISMDKGNKGAYIEIKNKYMEKQRLDDAYYFIKLAINNNVDIENMKQLLNDIKSKFEVAKMDVNVYQNDNYNLPNKIKIKINNEDKEVDVVWNNKNADTSKLGTVKYEGKIEQYERSAELNLKVMKVQKEKKVGWISDVYEDGDTRYLKYDEVEFFLDKDANDWTAEIEAKKDGANGFDTDGRVFDDYYIRNKDKSITTYKISPNAEIIIWNYDKISVGSKMAEIKISYQEFKSMSKFGIENYKHKLFYVYLENNVIVKIEQQFLP